MVEGGTLLRCYTSERGIEGSNPSSSAPKIARLQYKRRDQGTTGTSPDSIYTTWYTNARVLLYKPMYAHCGVLPDRYSMLRERVRGAAREYEARGIVRRVLYVG